MYVVRAPRVYRSVLSTICTIYVKGMVNNRWYYTHTVICIRKLLVVPGTNRITCQVWVVYNNSSWFPYVRRHFLMTINTINSWKWLLILVRSRIKPWIIHTSARDREEYFYSSIYIRWEEMHPIYNMSSVIRAGRSNCPRPETAATSIRVV